MLKSIPLEAPISKIPMQAYKWFIGKEPLIAKVIQNKPEAQIRLTWLSEGSLHYHISQFQTKYFGPDGDPSEKELYKQFRLYLSRLSPM